MLQDPDREQTAPNPGPSAMAIECNAPMLQSEQDPLPSPGNSSDPPELDTNSQLLRSFDMIFQLHQRSEEIRIHLEKIDRILLSSRTVAGLTERVTRVLESELDLVAARVLFRADHPVTALFSWSLPENAGLIGKDFLEHEPISRSEPFVLDDPSGDLSFHLFGDAAPMVSSAVVTYLCADDEEMGLLCLASDDPQRYCGGMNTELIASLADKIVLGIRNAWDHERAVHEAIMPRVEEIYSEAFFQEYLHKEFDRAWRAHQSFSIIALSWKTPGPGPIPSVDEVSQLLMTNVRSSDVVAHGDAVNLWILMPQTPAAGAETAAHRLTSVLAEFYESRVTLHAGLTEFSRNAAVLPMMIKQARAALKEAQESESSSIMVKGIELAVQHPEMADL